ncbi:hypothetical protein ABZV24_05175 [Streptomyces sp. NPDC005251]|uniref:hypothetical protein n=1 Tax=Streptomyces sp. NPDC005251 TaxID=3157166 RepID=UPI0033AEBABC
MRGEEVGPARPSLVAHERQEAQKRQARRRTFRLALRGIDIRTRLFDGMEVTA